MRWFCLVSFLPQKSMFLQYKQLNFWLCARILTCSLYWMDTWLGQQVLRTGAVHCEPPESAASPPHQRFLKAYSHMVPVPRSLLRSYRATSCSSADRHRIHLYGYTYFECLINWALGLDGEEMVQKNPQKTTKTTGALLNNIAYSNCSRNLAYWQNYFLFWFKTFNQ